MCMRIMPHLRMTIGSICSIWIDVHVYIDATITSTFEFHGQNPDHAYPDISTYM